MALLFRLGYRKAQGILFVVQAETLVAVLALVIRKTASGILPVESVEIFRTHA